LKYHYAKSFCKKTCSNVLHIFSKTAVRLARLGPAPMWRALARRAPLDARRVVVVHTRGVSVSRSAASRPPVNASASIAGENTREYLVKVPSASLEAGLNASQARTRSRLLTITSVAAAAYLGYFIFPLVGGGTASSAVKMCTSKDVLFRRAGVSRLRNMLRVSRDGAHVKHAVENGACEILIRLIVEDGGGAGGGGGEKKKGSRGLMSKQSSSTNALSDTGMNAAKAKADARRALAVDACFALVELAKVSTETRNVMAGRETFVVELMKRVVDESLDGEIRAALAEVIEVLKGSGE
jgi:hypothetical protein